jgi:hypothetical protein
MSLVAVVEPYRKCCGSPAGKYILFSTKGYALDTIIEKGK